MRRLLYTFNSVVLDSGATVMLCNMTSCPWTFNSVVLDSCNERCNVVCLLGINSPFKLSILLF